MSANDQRIHFGLDKRTKIDSLVITWPSGHVDKLANIPIDKIIAAKEGTGIVPRKFQSIQTMTDEKNEASSALYNPNQRSMNFPRRRFRLITFRSQRHAAETLTTPL